MEDGVGGGGDNVPCMQWRTGKAVQLGLHNVAESSAETSPECSQWLVTDQKKKAKK